MKEEMKEIKSYLKTALKLKAQPTIELNDLETLVAYIDQQDQIIREAKEKLSFIDKSLEEDTLNTMLCITKINKAIEILDRNVK